MHEHLKIEHTKPFFNRDNLWCVYCKNYDIPTRRAGDFTGNHHLLDAIVAAVTCSSYNKGADSYSSLSEAIHQETNASKGSEFNGLNTKVIEKLRSLFSSLDKTNALCSLAQSGMFSKYQCFSISENVFSSSWIIDSGAIDHMTHSSLNSLHIVHLQRFQK